jgi:hypothetical protein
MITISYSICGWILLGVIVAFLVVRWLEHRSRQGFYYREITGDEDEEI